MKNKRLVRGKVVVERGFGPRHAFNAQEGSEVVPSALPDVPQAPPDRGDRLRRMLIDQVVSPGQRAEMAQNPLGMKSLATMAGLGGALLGGGEGEGLVSGESGPILTRANRNGTTIRASFDATKAAPDPKVLEQQFADAGHNVSVTKFQPDLLSATKGEHNYRIDVWDNNNRLSSDAAAKAMEGMFGADAPYRGQTQFEQVAPLEDRYGAAHEYGSKKLSDAELASQEQDRKGKTKVGVAKGFGPTHAENSKEGDLTQVNTDTVPAMLTPREAVLNRNAAELAGRGTIEKLNEDGNELAKKGVDLAARGQTSVAPVMPTPVAASSRPVASSDVMKFLRSAALAQVARSQVPKLAVQGGDDDVPANAWGGEQPSLGQRLYHDFGDPAAMTDKATKDLMHFLAQFGAPTEPKQVDPLGSPISNQEMMRRYPGLKFQEGEDDTPYPMRLPFEGAEAAREDEQQYRDSVLDDLDEKMRARGVPPLRWLRDAKDMTGKSKPLPSLQEFIPAVQKGTSDMKPKPKSKNAIYNSSGGAPPPPQSGSPYVQGFLKQLAGAGKGVPPQSPQPQGFRRGGFAGMGGRAFAASEGYGGTPQGGSYGDPMPAQSTNPAPWKLGGLAYGDPAGQPQWKLGGAGVGGDPVGTAPQLGGALGGGGGGWGGDSGRSSSFYPRGGGYGFAGGTSEVNPEGIGAPAPGATFPQVQFSAPNIMSLLQHGQQNGLSAGQVQGLMKAVQGFGKGYNELTGGAGSASDMAGAPTGAGYQGGISDIGYPPMLMPDATYHADKGSSWVGPYDPNYLVQRYARGTSEVPFL